MSIATTLLILLCCYVFYALAAKQCCHGENIITANGTCWDGSNVTSLTCTNKVLLGPIHQAPADITIEENDFLKVNQQATGRYKVPPDKYCLTGFKGNATDMVLLCVETYTNKIEPCCGGKNVITTNGTCWDGSNVTSLDCETKELKGPIEESPADIEIDESDFLKVTNEAATGFYRVPPNKYCVTGLEENATNTMALICGKTYEDQIEPTLKWTTAFCVKVVCALTTVVFLLAVIVIYLFTPNLRDIEGKCVINCIFAFCLAHFFYVVSPIIRALQLRACNTVSFIFDTSTLCTFTWLSVISFHFWRITIRPIFRSHLNWFWIYFCYGYGLPLLLLATSLILHNSYKTGLDASEEFECWVDGSLVVWGYFYVPLLIMVLISTVLQLWAAKKIWWDISRKDHSQPDVQRLRKKSKVYLHLLLVMGLTQVVDTIIYPLLNRDEVLDYVLDINDSKNLLMGIVIFLILVVFRNKVLKELGRQGLFCIKFPKKWEKLVDEESEVVEYENMALARDSSSL